MERSSQRQHKPLTQSNWGKAWNWFVMLLYKVITTHFLVRQCKFKSSIKTQNISWTWKRHLLQTFFFSSIKKRGNLVRSRFVPVDAFVLLRPAPSERVEVFGSQPRVSAQRGVSQAQRQQPTDTDTHTDTLHWDSPPFRTSGTQQLWSYRKECGEIEKRTSLRPAACGGPRQTRSVGRPSSCLQSHLQLTVGVRNRQHMSHV